MKDGRYREPDVEIYAKGELAVELFRDSLLDFKMVRALRKCCTIASSHHLVHSSELVSLNFLTTHDASKNSFSEIEGA